MESFPEDSVFVSPPTRPTIKQGVNVSLLLPTCVWLVVQLVGLQPRVAGSFLLSVGLFVVYKRINITLFLSLAYILLFVLPALIIAQDACRFERCEG